jgi:hypothetical protein
VRKQLRLLLDAWLASLRETGVRLLLLALGESAAVRHSQMVRVGYLEAQQ